MCKYEIENTGKGRKACSQEKLVKGVLVENLAP